jgi:hypothetical protein
LPGRLKLLAVLYVLSGVLYVALSALIGLVGGSGTADGFPVVPLYLWAGAAFVLGGASICAGAGLMRRKEWGRPFSTLLALVLLAFVPIGTLFGAFALWALSSSSRVVTAANNGSGEQ